MQHLRFQFEEESWKSMSSSNSEKAQCVTGTTHNFSFCLTEHLAPVPTLPHLCRISLYLQRHREDQCHWSCFTADIVRDSMRFPEVWAFIKRSWEGSAADAHSPAPTPSEWGEAQVNPTSTWGWKRSVVWSTREWIRVSNSQSKLTYPTSSMKSPLKVSSPEKQAVLWGNPTYQGHNHFFVKYLKKKKHL